MVFNKDYINSEKKEKEKKPEEKEENHTESTVKSSNTPTIHSTSGSKKETDKTKALKQVF